MALFTTDYAVFDFETGGLLNSRGGRPVEMAVLTFIGGTAEITSMLVNPFVDDSGFLIEEGAQRVHGLSREKVEAEGVSPKTAVAQFMSLVGGEMPVWAHNGCGFDFLIHEAEAARYDLPSLARGRWRDSAALYKGWKLGRMPKEGEDLRSYFTSVLRIRRRGLYFNLGHLTKALDLGIRGKGEEEWDFGGLGLSESAQAETASLGQHRAGFDCILTHALIQWMQRNWQDMIVKS